MKEKWKLAAAGLLILGLLVGLDQWTKCLAVTYLAGNKGIALWPGVFELVYLENRGMAFGLLQNQQTLFRVLTVLVLCLLAVIYWRMPASRRFLPMRFTCVLLMAGAIGNFIDRVRLSYVVDFFYFKWIDFPIFNVADCYVTVSAFLLLGLTFFYYKEEELSQCIGLKGKGK